MSYILDISTAVPQYAVSNKELSLFYSRALDSTDLASDITKLDYFIEKTKITNRFSCIPDFNGKRQELFTDSNYIQRVEKRTSLYKEKILPLACSAIDKILIQNQISSNDITHIITASCTGVFAPGLEYLLSGHYGLHHTEKTALNFLGCYAAIKALKHAYYITQSDPDACVLIACAELCSLHFYPSGSNEDIIANLLFSDGAAAALVCGKKSRQIKNKIVFDIASIGSSHIPDTMECMTWNISSNAFRMYLSKNIVTAIQASIEDVVLAFLKGTLTPPDYWAIHPGGIRIIQSIKNTLNLNEKQVEDSMRILSQFGNMSSPTILFILKRIMEKIKKSANPVNRSVFSCAFGPGLTIEMLRLVSADTSLINKSNYSKEKYVVQI